MIHEDPIWAAARNIAEQAWDAASDGNRTQAALRALADAGITGKTAVSVLGLIASNGRRE